MGEGEGEVRGKRELKGKKRERKGEKGRGRGKESALRANSRRASAAAESRGAFTGEIPPSEIIHSKKIQRLRKALCLRRPTDSSPIHRIYSRIHDLFSHPFGFDCLANISKFCCNTIKVEHNQFGELRNPIVPMTVKAILIYSRRRLKFKLSSILVTEWFKKVKE